MARTTERLTRERDGWGGTSLWRCRPFDPG
jgi:hypothetical protein